MNKYLMMRVAALAATVAVCANPGGQQLGRDIEHNGSITYCDQIDLSWHRNLLCGYPQLDALRHEQPVEGHGHRGQDERNSARTSFCPTPTKAM